MKINFNMDRLIDLMIEADNYANDYYRACQKYKKDHGHIAYIDYRKGLSDEEKHIEYLEHWRQSASDSVVAVVEILGFDAEQYLRLVASSRAMKRWYEKTKWQRLPEDGLLERIERFVVGKSA